jgi:hypothetical protein
MSCPRKFQPRGIAPRAGAKCHTPLASTEFLDECAGAGDLVERLHAFFEQFNASCSIQRQIVLSGFASGCVLQRLDRDTAIGDMLVVIPIRVERKPEDVQERFGAASRIDLVARRQCAVDVEECDGHEKGRR